jgi:hypothetical protein
MARKRTCAVCDGDHFRQVTVTLPSGKTRDTDFVYCCRCLLMFYRKLERELDAPPILSIGLLRTLSAAVISDAMRKLPDPNKCDTDSVSSEHWVDYHGKVKIEFERTTGESNGHTWNFWVAKTASKVT